MRRLMAAALACTLAALPFALDRCLGTCELQKPAAEAVPSCHHSAASGARIAQVPAACGHSHRMTAATPAATPHADSRLVLGAPVSAPAPAPLIGRGCVTSGESPPFAFARQSSPLRI
ncbi:MAG TPA: hypothetical protein VEU08_03645 [Vicinamibacterales bacterium]|nr:hypothetical protein [Vicinamibacterales bacterium]